MYVFVFNIEYDITYLYIMFHSYLKELFLPIYTSRSFPTSMSYSYLPPEFLCNLPSCFFPLDTFTKSHPGFLIWTRCSQFFIQVHLVSLPRKYHHLHQVSGINLFYSSKNTELPLNDSFPYLWLYLIKELIPYPLNSKCFPEP